MRTKNMLYKYLLKIIELAKQKRLKIHHNTLKRCSQKYEPTSMFHRAIYVLGGSVYFGSIQKIKQLHWESFVCQRLNVMGKSLYHKCC